MPSAPDPAYRSSTRAPSTTSRCSSRENSASRTRSLVGRVPARGTCSMRPPTVPATIRVTGALPPAPAPARPSGVSISDRVRMDEAIATAMTDRTICAYSRGAFTVRSSTAIHTGSRPRIDEVRPAGEHGGDPRRQGTHRRRDERAAPVGGRVGRTPARPRRPTRASRRCRARSSPGTSDAHRPTAANATTDHSSIAAAGTTMRSRRTVLASSGSSRSRIGAISARRAPSPVALIATEPATSRASSTPTGLASCGTVLTSTGTSAATTSCTTCRAERRSTTRSAVIRADTGPRAVLQRRDPPAHGRGRAVGQRPAELAGVHRDDRADGLRGHRPALPQGPRRDPAEPAVDERPRAATTTGTSPTTNHHGAPGTSSTDQPTRARTTAATGARKSRTSPASAMERRDTLADWPTAASRTIPAATRAAVDATRTTRRPGSASSPASRSATRTAPTKPASSGSRRAAGRSSPRRSTGSAEPPGRLRSPGADGSEPSRERQQRARERHDDDDDERRQAQRERRLHLGRGRQRTRASPARTRARCRR